jgi:hypothetical protein
MPLPLDPRELGDQLRGGERPDAARASRRGSLAADEQEQLAPSAAASRTSSLGRRLSVRTQAALSRYRCQHGVRFAPHRGMLFVVVQSGSVVREVGCDSHTYSAGDAFIESDAQPAGQVSNRSSTTPAVLTVTQIVPHASGRRVEADPLTC